MKNPTRNERQAAREQVIATLLAGQSWQVVNRDQSVFRQHAQYSTNVQNVQGVSRCGGGQFLPKAFARGFLARTLVKKTKRVGAKAWIVEPRTWEN